MISLLRAGAAKVIRTRNRLCPHSASQPAGQRAGARRWRRRLSSEEGATMVETAISCTILFMLIIGICQMSLALYSYHSVSEAARLATRWAIVRGANCSYLTGCGAGNTDIQQYLQGAALPGIVPANLSTTTTWYTVTMDTSVSPANAVLSKCGTDPKGCNVPGNEVQIQVTYKFPLSIPFVPSSTLSLSSTSEMAISQ